MFEVIKQDIENLPKKSFDELFISYIMELQDVLISYEIKSLRRNNIVNSVGLQKLINTEIESGVLNDFNL